MARKQIINPLVGFAQRSIGPYANRIGAATHARHVGLGDFEPPVVATLYAFAADGQGTLKGLVTGTGSMAFARASDASVTDFEGLVKTALANELRFEYGRRVENALSANDQSLSSEDITSGSSIYSMYSGGSIDDADTFTITAGASALRANLGAAQTSRAPVTAGGTITITAEIRADTPGTINMSANNTTDWNSYNTDQLVDITADWQRFSLTTTNSTNPGGYVAIFFGATALSGGTKAGVDYGTYQIRNIQIEDVTGQSNQNPSEYVSVGVLSGDYHGVGVDGVKYFSTTNGNTVDGNKVITEGTGATLWGDELNSQRDLSDWITSEVTLGGSVIALDGTTLTNNGVIPSANEGSNHYIAKIPVISTDNVPYTYRFRAQKGPGSDWVHARFVSQAGTWCSAFFNVNTGVVGTVSNCTATIADLGGGWFECDIVANSETGSGELVYIFCADADNDINITTGDGATVWTYIDFPELRLGAGEWYALFESAAGDDGTEMFQRSGNFDPANGMIVGKSIVGSVPGTQEAWVGTRAGSIGGVTYYEATNKTQLNDGTTQSAGQAGNSFASGEPRSWAGGWGKDGQMWSGMATADSWTFGALTPFDGAMPSDADISVFNQQGASNPFPGAVRIKNLTIYDSDQGTGWIEANF